MKFTNHRGYTAVVLVSNEERVIYTSYDQNGQLLQENNCVSRKFFTENWS